jgi:hypothetical protein
MRKLPFGHRSQSEADWAYAKRALARGDHPEEIIRKIADYRAEDKADPDYYARLTVNKAQSQFAIQVPAAPGAQHRDERSLDEHVPSNSTSSREV